MINGWLTITALHDGEVVKMFHEHGERLFQMMVDEDGRDILVEEFVNECGTVWIEAVIDFNTLLKADCMVMENYKRSKWSDDKKHTYCYVEVVE